MARVPRQTRGGFGVLLLAAQVMQIGTDRIPPVTFGTVILNAVIYMRLIPSMPTVHAACTSNFNVIDKLQWKRLLLSSFYHLDDMHLYFNMVSFISKGLTLERKLKSRKFLVVLALFSVLTQVVMLSLNHIFAEIFVNEQYKYTCAAGFSAVIFALKVLTTNYSNDNVSVMGIPIVVPSKYACWVELILIQLLVPNASFTGHLAGIIVGLMYVHGPLMEKIVNLIDSILSGGVHSRQSAYNYEQGTTNNLNHNQTAYPQQETRSNLTSTYEDEQLQRAIQESLRETSLSTQRDRNQPPPVYGWNIPEDIHSNTTDNLYPDLSTTGELYPPESAPTSPSAPPYYGNEGPAPYPIDNNYPSCSTPLPYATDDYSPRQNPSVNLNNRENTEDIDFIRATRLRRFDKQK